MNKMFLLSAAAAMFLGGCCGNNPAPSSADAVLDAIATRKSVRKFDTSRKLDDAIMEKLLRAGMAAPTAMNRQPWSFVVVSDPAVKNEIASRHPHAKMAADAAALIIVCGNKNNGIPDKGTEYGIQDCSAATENILLAAHALGLGAVWCGVHPIDERVDAVREILQIPATHQPLNVICIGYPAENPPPKDKWVPSKIHSNKW